MGKGCESWDSFCLEKVGVGQNLVNVHKKLRARCKEEVTRLLSVEPSVRARGKGQKLKCRRLHLNIRKHFFCAVRVAEHWYELPERLWSLHLWRYSRAVLSRPWEIGSRWPCLSMGAGQGDL